MTAPGWKALVVEWKDLVRHYPDGFELQEGQAAIARLVERHGGYVEDTGGGVEVGFVELRTRAGIVSVGTATVSDEMIALWIGDEPFVDMPTEEIFAAEVLG